MSNHSSELVEISKLNGDFNRGRHPARVNAQDPSLSQPGGGFFVSARGWILLNAFIARRAWSAALRLPALSTCSSAHTRYCKAASTSGSRCLANKRSLILHTRQGIAGSKRKENGPFLITDNRCWHRSFAGKSSPASARLPCAAGSSSMPVHAPLI